MARLVFWSLLGAILLPICVIFLSFTSIELSVWQHLSSTVLPDYLINSFLLASGVGIGVSITGATVAWCLSRYEFTGRSILGWLSVLPLAMPAYIIAYTYTGFLDYSGPVQQALRQWFGWGYGDYWFPEIRSLGGAIAMMTLVLYPYVYLLARNAFSSIPRNLHEATQSLGKNERQYLWGVVLPIARPAITAGGLLAVMESLADYGTVAFFGVSTFTTGIFRTWYGMGSQTTALQLSGLLLIFVFCCVFWEQKSRRSVQQQTQSASTSRIHLKGISAFLAFLVCFIPVLLGFILPIYQLSKWVLDRQSDWQLDTYLPLVSQTLMLALSGALLVLFVAVFMSYVKRWSGQKTPQWTLQFASMGYALPGVVVAVGLLVPLGWVDRSINKSTMFLFDTQPGLILSGTLFVLLFAYLIRFLAVALQHSQNGLARITPSMDEASYSFGKTRFQTLRKIHIPLMRNSMLAAVLLVFVDIMKELPATLVLRPFNFNTLAVKAYEYAMDERLQQAALPALTIVLCGLLPVFLLITQLRKNEDAYVAS